MSFITIHEYPLSNGLLVWLKALHNWLVLLPNVGLIEREKRQLEAGLHGSGYDTQNSKYTPHSLSKCLCCFRCFFFICQ